MNEMSIKYESKLTNLKQKHSNDMNKMRTSYESKLSKLTTVNELQLSQ